MPPDEPILDPLRIEMLRSLDDGRLLGELIEMFTRETPQRLDEARVALAAHDSGVLAATAHRLKGTAGNIGAPRLMEFGASLESAALAADLETCATVMAQIDAHTPEVLAALDALRGPAS